MQFGEVDHVAYVMYHNSYMHVKQFIFYYVINYSYRIYFTAWINVFKYLLRCITAGTFVVKLI